MTTLRIPVLNTARVLVVDDDPAYRRILDLSLRRIGVTDVVAASSVAIARAKLERERFDLVTIDVVMRDESGLELLAWVRDHRPELVPILVTAGTASEACTAVDGLLLGAAGLIIKPGGADAPALLDRALRDVVASVAARVNASLAPPRSPTTPPPRDATRPRRRELIAIGASTGGPVMVLELLNALKDRLRLPIVVTQHMGAPHLPHFAALLAERTGLPVTVAEDGEPLVAGHVYVAPGAKHLVVDRVAGKLVARLDLGPEEHHCRPAVDPMFRSVARTCGASAIAIVLTGMGSDGALGAELLHTAGAPVAAQDRASSVVWGMPGAVVARHAADLVGPVGQIAAWVRTLESTGGLE